METKRHFFLARAAMTLLLTVFTTLTTWADTWPAYITDVVLAGGTETEAQSVKNSTAYSGYTWCSTSLNDGTSGDVIYIGYKKSSSPAYINGGYITDFIIIDAGTGTEGHNPPYSLTFQGRTYYRCPAAGGDYFVNSNHGNLTSQAANGWNMYLYYTKANFSDKRAVDGISIYSVGDINEHKSGAINCYYKDGTLHEKEISLNKGVSKTPYVYMHINTVTKTNRPSTDPVMASGLVYNGSEQMLVASMGTTYDNTYKMWFREIGQNQYFYENTAQFTKATNAGTYNVEYYAGSSTYGDKSETKIHQVTIAKSPNNGLTVSCSNYLEGTAPVPSLVGNNLSTGTITYKYSTSQNGTYTTTVPSEPGTHWVKATIAGDGNCYAYTTAPVSFTITYDWALHNSGDTEADAYVISTTSDLNLLAQRVNGGNSYSGKCFRLGGNITYSHTSVWDNTTSTENNYTPIGNNNENKFKGHFDGKEYTVSGIRISASNYYNGLFGNLDGATVKNVILSDARIMSTAQYCGGIAGYCSSSTITNCWVKSNVCVGKNNYVGGIVGEIVTGTIMGCRSEAMLKDDSNNRERYGGIAGTVQGQANVKHCIVVGASVPNTNYHGAIVGRWIGNYTNNYYINCTVAGVADATNVGSEGSDRKGARKAVAINTADGVTVTPTGTATTFDVRGITAYEGNNGILYGGKLYAGATEQVRLTVGYTAPADYALNGYTDGHDNTLTTHDDGTYTLTMTAEAATVTPDGVCLWGTASGADGSQDHPYVITTPAGLDLLAKKANGGNKYQYSYFVLGDNITYDADALTLDLDGDGNNDSNYMPVGKNGFPFSGNFDGQGHTISGIRVNTNNMDYIGVFGVNDGTVKNLTVSDCLFAGSSTVGAIAGLTRGTVENCHVAASVSVTGKNRVGGVVSKNEGSVIGCTSAAALSAKEYARYFGGIAGSNAGTLTDNLFTGTIGKMPDGSWGIGAITGYHNTDYDGMLTNNFHTCSDMGGVGNEGNATNTDQAGAQLAYEFPTANGAMGNTGSTYGTGGYTGITAYEHGLAYNGKFYSPSPWGGSGTAEDPYIIVNTQGMDLLATNVNDGNGYEDTYFVLGDNITYDADAVTLDLDGDGNNDSNYMPVGKDGSSFSGNFDGQGHTIKGIRVNANGMFYIGVFGINDGTVKNLTVSDCLFAGYGSVGAIAGLNRGTVENCHVAAYVSVIGNNTVGGVVGDNGCSVLGCTSVAKLSAKEYARYFGGIAGYNSGTLTDNLFTGTIGEMPDGSWGIGAITGNNNTERGTLTNNFHTCSGMGGVGNDNDATNTDQAGAQLAYEFPTANGAMGNAGNTYGTGDYTGITVYEHGLAYNGKFYSPSPWAGSGTEGDPYVIVSTAGLDLLATNVIGGNSYEDTYFVLGDNITYDADALTLDLDNDGNNDSNYMPVGKDGSSFYGNFDGQGHTISGIRVNTNNMGYIGVFGVNDGTVKNLTVSDCLFAGSSTVGAIAGLTRGTVENCHVATYVSVIGNNTVGGVVGDNEGSVLGCTSAAALSAKEHAAYFGGIAGYNSGTLTDNLFTGTIDKMSNSSICIGAITGYHNTELGGMLTNNFHTCSGMGGVGNDNDATSTDVDGALFAASSDTEPDAATIGTAGTAYAAGETYEGITPYTHGLYYNGLYYYKDPNIAVWTGKGTEKDPYVIRTTAELDLLATRVNSDNKYDGKYFELGADITYDGTENNFTPIGENGCWFYGSFDGKGHTISGIRISDTNGRDKAIFGQVFRTVKNLVVSDCRIEAYQNIGGIVAILQDGTIENCHVLNDVTLTGYMLTGGIDGDLEGGTIIGCTSAARIIGTKDGGNNALYLGGIVGTASDYSDSPKLTDNLFTGTISGDFDEYIGAIVGKNNSNGTTLTNNYYTAYGLGGVGDEGSVIGSDEAGAQFAVSSTTMPDAATIGTAGTAYAKDETYQGITPYTHGLFYGGRYYYVSIWGGSGTEDDPYVIYNTAGLNKLASDVNDGNKYDGKYFELGADITYNKTKENNFTPIGNIDKGFYGTFDGKGHTISGIRISETNGTYKAIFGRIGGTVKNLVVSDCHIEARQDIGGIVAELFGTIENCHVLSDVTLTGYTYVGGITANIERGTIIGCTSAATITGTRPGGNAYSLGGIASFASEYAGDTSTLIDNLFTGTISGNLGEFIGAIVGENNSDGTTLTNNYYTCSGLGGVGDAGSTTGSDVAGALFAVSSNTKPDAATIGTAGTAYPYQGIMPYTHGLYYGGLYYYNDPNIVAWAGQGTETTPYVIRTTAELDLLASKVSGGIEYNNTYFELGDDIAYDKSQENNYTPIGNNDYYFMGHFDGKGHKVSGLNIYLPENNHVGLFGFIYSGSVKNLTLTNSIIIGQQYVGSIAGQIIGDATIENCHVTSDCDVNGDYCVGGIVGITDNSTIGGCTSAATVSGKQYVGGIVCNNSSTIQDCLYLGTSVTATEKYHVGAIVGWNNSDVATLTNNYHTLSGVGGVGNEDDATSSDVAGKAEFAVSSTTKPDAATIGTAGTPYAEGETYQGITPYTHGLFYGGRYYWHGTVRRGDANGDSVVNISDAVAIVNYILGKEVPAGFNVAAADMNGDGRVTVTDAVMLVNMIGSQP